MTPEQESDLFQTLGRIEATLESLSGNGQPGRVGRLEIAVHRLELWVENYKGRTGVIAIIASFVATAIIEIGISLLKK